MVGGVNIADGSITGAKLITSQAVITNNAQIGDAVIGGSKLQNGTITTNQIAADTITANNLVKTQALITTAAQIQDAIVSTAKIGDLQVTSLKIGDNAVTATAYYDYTAPVAPPQSGAWQVMDTITINGTGNKHIIQATVEHNITDGFDFGDTAWGPPVKDYTYLSSIS